MAKLRVFLADDHAVVREGLKSLISVEADMEVVGEAPDGATAVEKIQQLAPDVAILDVSMPRLNGVEAALQVKRRAPRVRLLALTVHEDRSYLRQILAAGVSGYVLKRAAAMELIGAIRAIATGGTYIDPAVAATLLGSLASGGPDGDAQMDETLSDREVEVLRLIASGYINKEVAVRLGVSTKSVETYKARCMAKLGLKSRVDIVRYALREGWLKEA